MYLHAHMHTHMPASVQSRMPPRVALAARSKKLWKSFGCFRSSRPEALAMEGMTDLSRAIQASHVHMDTGFTGLPMVYKHHVYKIEYKYTVYIIYLQIFIHTYTRVCIYIYIYIMFILMYINYMSKRTHAHMHTYISKYVRIYPYTYTRICCVCICVCMFTYT